MGKEYWWKRERSDFENILKKKQNLMTDGIISVFFSLFVLFVLTTGKIVLEFKNGSFISGLCGKVSWTHCGSVLIRW